MSTPSRQVDLERAAAPVQRYAAASPHDRAEREPEEGIALCLSGGGYRAMLFHLGALWRLNETGHLHRLARVSSVSGGSIIAGVLALNWERLAFDGTGVAAGFDEQIVAPVRAMAGRTIDWQAILLGTLLPGTAERAARRRLPQAPLRRHDPAADPDRTRVRLQRHQPAIGRALALLQAVPVGLPRGEVKSPTLELAVAVAASSAFPPFLSPVVLDLDDGSVEPGTGNDLQHPPFTTRVVLADGGVYDNLGLETAWKRTRPCSSPTAAAT